MRGCCWAGLAVPKPSLVGQGLVLVVPNPSLVAGSGAGSVKPQSGGPGSGAGAAWVRVWGGGVMESTTMAAT